jgi:hypothetical protein
MGVGRLQLLGTRALGKGSKKKKGKGAEKKKPLKAKLKPLDEEGDFGNLDGWAEVEVDDGELIIDYYVENGPKRCGDCKLQIMTGRKCSKLYDPYYNTDEDPWKPKKTNYVTNIKKEAAGHFKTDNGYGYDDNECKFVVLFDSDDDRRRLTSDGRRALKKSGKGKKDKGPKKIACGQLIPKDKDDSYC